MPKQISRLQEAVVNFDVAGNKVLDAVKRILTADTYLRRREEDEEGPEGEQHRPSSDAGPPESPRR